jgi:hypothetical protein
VEYWITSADNSCSRRILTLSNWQQARDIWWNVWEHVDRWNNPYTTTVNTWVWNLCWIPWLTTYYWYQSWNPSASCAYSTVYWPAYNQWWSDIWMWGVLSSSDWNSDKIFLRWASWVAAVIANVWVYAFRSDSVYTASDRLWWFRCAYK